MKQDIVWKHITDFDKTNTNHVLIRDYDGNIHTVYYSIWNEGNESGEYHVWRDDNDNNYDFDQHQWWAEILINTNT